MSRTVKVTVKNVIEFEISDNSDISHYDQANFIALAKKAVMQMPQSELMNSAKYKVKESK